MNMTYIYPFGIVWMILWWALIIGAVFAAIRWLSGSRHHCDYGRDTALDILKQRYAKGEINKEEFEEKQKILSQAV